MFPEIFSELNQIWHPGGACILDGTWFGDLKDEDREIGEIHRVLLICVFYMSMISQ